MPFIFIIDDDAASQLLADNLSYRGHTAVRLRSVTEALDRIQEVSKSDLVILDLVMPEDHGQQSYAGESRSSGMLVYKRLRELAPSLPIIVYTANQDGGIIDALESDASTTYVSRWSGPSLTSFVALISSKLGIVGSPAGLRSFIVHGRDETAKLSLKNFLQNTLSLPEPIILHEQPNLGRTIIEKFEDLSESVDLVFVLMTPDDVMAVVSDSEIVKRHARQNVIFELGYFLGHLGRRSGRVFLLYKNGLELPSDLNGVVYLDISNGIETVSDQIRLELRMLTGGEETYGRT